MKIIQEKLFNKINLKKNLELITIDGITCSGKSIFADLLKNFFKKKNVYILSKDLFLFSRKKRIQIDKKIKKQSYFNQNELHYDLKKLNKLMQFLFLQSKKKSLTLTKLYDRKTGKNNKKMKFKLLRNTLIIFEGLYVLDDIKKIVKPKYKILLIDKVYLSLARKIERIRDKKISIQHVISDFTRIHLKSFNKYLIKQNFNCSFIGVDKNFVLIKQGKKRQVNLINQFFKKHLF
tara:strand:+ start:503 stop:1204 length:702 start_codon:yes stop_codon:yes gene_type:complete